MAGRIDTVHKKIVISMCFILYGGMAKLIKRRNEEGDWKR